MILWSFPIKEEKEIKFKDIGCRAWRWTFEINSWKNGISIGFNHRVRFGNKDNKFERAIHYYEISLTKKFRFGSSHNYYDGPHCGFSIGPIHFNWSGNWCKKCMPDD